VLRLNLSRGPGVRGYLPRGAGLPTVVMSLHPASPLRRARPQSWKVVTSRLRVQLEDPMTRHKTTNKLLHVLAQMEAVALDADEALLLNTSDEMAEAASANIFWVREGEVRTPPVEAGALPGITRGLVLEICHGLGMRCREETGECGELFRAGGVFLTLSSLGIVEAISLNGTKLPRSPAVRRIWTAYLRELDRATR